MIFPWQSKYIELTRIIYGLIYTKPKQFQNHALTVGRCCNLFTVQVEFLQRLLPASHPNFLFSEEYNSIQTEY